MSNRLVSAILFALGSILVAGGISLLSFATSGVALASPPTDRDPFEDFACLECHTDQSRLNELAPPIEEVPEESLSSGPG